MATNDTIQLMEDAVYDRLPLYATEDHMYEALDNCGMTEDEIYAALERKYDGAADQQPVEVLATDIRELLFSSFDTALESATLGRENIFG